MQVEVVQYWNIPRAVGYKQLLKKKKKKINTSVPPDEAVELAEL